jgi:hypothetical protein
MSSFEMAYRPCIWSARPSPRPTATFSGNTDRHLAPQGPPRLTEHVRCGGPVDVGFVCPACGTGVGPGELAPHPNPAYPAEVPARLAP